MRCQTGSTAPPVLRTEEAPAAAAGARNAQAGFTVVMKFGGSSLASAERMREVAGLILSFPDETPVVVLSAMGKTTNNLLLAGEKAVSCGAPKASEIPELAVIKDLHLRTVDELGLDRSIVSGMLLFAPLCSWNASAVPLALSGMLLLAIQRDVVLLDVPKFSLP